MHHAAGSLARAFGNALLKTAPATPIPALRTCETLVPDTSTTLPSMWWRHIVDGCVAAPQPWHSFGRIVVEVVVVDDDAEWCEPLQPASTITTTIARRIVT